MSDFNFLISGIGTDLIVYSILVPVLPFQLEKLGYSGVSVRTSWLLFSYVSLSVQMSLHVCSQGRNSLLVWLSVSPSPWIKSFKADISPLATIPAALFSEKYDARKAPLVLGVLVLIGSQIMLMEAPVYWLMCLARILQGMGSTMVWVVGLALL